MVFSSLSFLCVFLPVVFLLYLAIPTLRLKNALLILASLFFYAYGEPIYIFLMIISSIMNYIFARLIAGRLPAKSAKALVAGSEDVKREADLVVSSESAASPVFSLEPPSSDSAATGGITTITATYPRATRRKLVLVLAVIANLGFLAVFKYTGMFMGTADSLLGLSLTIPVIALPIGISFYTFQAMSYVIDVYRGKASASKSYFKVLLYISFFPQLIAGPIIKYSDVDQQLDNRRVTTEGVAKGLRRFSVGLAKKVLIANNMALVADAVFAAGSSEVNAAVVWIGAFAYLMQIYFDFSGYSDMAIGLARIFGFEYKENFNYPYTSSSITEFWRRWHISLSSWFKEYLYIPLGGNRRGKLRASLNKIVVFFLCGLWHGASWTFVIWGFFHGLFLLLEQYLPIRRLPKALGFVYAILVVMVGFVLFRAESITQAGFFIAQMFTGWHFEAATVAFATEQLTPLFIVVSLVAIIACMPVSQWLRAGLGNLVTRSSSSTNSPTKVASFIKGVGFVLSIVLLLLCIMSLSSGGYNPFIYFRF